MSRPYLNPTLVGVAVAALFLELFTACSTDVKRPQRTVDAGRDTGGTPPVDVTVDAGFAAAEDASAPDASPKPAEDAGVMDGSDAPKAEKPIVILMIGDGMGSGQREAASLYAHGQAGQLFLESLPHRGAIETGSLSGITDSAAAATTMATGQKTWNRAIGIGRDGRPAETILERAQREGLGAGVVSTASLPHATPAGFSAHFTDRNNYLEIADDQAHNVRPLVALGGGTRFYAPSGAGSDRHDQGLIAPLVADGWQFASTLAELNAADPAKSRKLLGVFAPEHLDYVLDRGPSTTQPNLSEMSLAAIRFLDTYERGFFLMIEGARIDMASHANDLPRAIEETLAFDDAVRAVATWAADKPNVTLIVTADHECGGLHVVQPRGAGRYPEVAWRWGNHTNAQIQAFSQGPGTEALDGVVRDHAFVHALMLSELLRAPLEIPARVLTPDGNLEDLRHRAVQQRVPSGFTPGFNQLDTMWVDADRYGLAVGIEGVFEWDHNAVVLLVDRDPGASTGAGVLGHLSDHTGRADSILSRLPLSNPSIPGYGADFAVVTFGGADPKIDELSADAGLRGLHAPFGAANDLAWFGVPVNFGEGARTRGVAASPVPGQGLEIFIPWTALYPERMGQGVPPNAKVALSAILVNDDGTYLSNQALPPFAATVVSNPGTTRTALPGAVIFSVDSDGDGVGDGEAEPEVSSVTP